MIKEMLKKVLGPPIQRIRRYKAESALTQLTSHKSPKLKAIGDALFESLHHTLSAKEQEMIT